MIKKPQIQKFRKTARELGAEKSEDQFDSALKIVARHMPVDKSTPKDEPEAQVERGRKG